MTNERNSAVYEAYLRFGDLVRGGRVTPSWVLGGPSFTYAEGGPQDRVIWVVDPVANTRVPLFDVERLRKALTAACGDEPAGNAVPFAAVQFVGPRTVAFVLEGTSWTLDLDSYAVARQPERTTFSPLALLASETARVTPTTFSQESFGGVGQMLLPEVPDPDGQWFASVQDGDVVLRATIDGKTRQLTSDGTATHFWHVEPVRWKPWSPDGQRLAALKVDVTGMARVPTIHWLQRLPQVEEVVTAPAGGVIDRNELYLLDVWGGSAVHVDLGDTTDCYVVVLGWQPDSRGLYVAKYDRLFKGIEVFRADPVTGRSRVVFTEVSDTFLTNHHWALWGTDAGFTVLSDGFLWRSARDGWAHLYRYDAGGNLLARLTEGAYPVTTVTHVDEAGEWVYFQAHGDPERLYDNHLYRVPLTGGTVERLTSGKGRHEIAFAPSSDCFVDVYSSVDAPPRSVLRAADGTELQVLEEADLSALQQVGYVPSQEHVVTAADGVTDLWVTLHLPYDFDPTQKYPVIEYVYGGPQAAKRAMDFGVPPSLPPGMDHQWNYHRALAQHGFIVLTMDGRGTPGRSKAFQDTIYRNWGSFEIADHAGAIRQLAERLPFLDLDRVGITGGSWGGHYTVRALVQAPDVYKVGISECPGYDSRGFTLYEPYLGMPADNKALYDAADVLRLAPQVRGRLLQTGGANDTGTQVDFFRMSEALVRAGIQHDTMTYPNAGHGFSGATGRYNNQLKTDWFLRHLKGRDA